MKSIETKYKLPQIIFYVILLTTNEQGHVSKTAELCQIYIKMISIYVNSFLNQVMKWLQNWYLQENKYLHR